MGVISIPAHLTLVRRQRAVTGHWLRSETNVGLDFISIIYHTRECLGVAVPYLPVFGGGLIKNNMWLISAGPREIAMIIRDVEGTQKL